LNNTLSFSLSYNFALDFQKVIALFATHHILEIKINHTTKNNHIINSVGKNSAQNSSFVLSFTKIDVFISGFFNPKSFIESFFGKIIISLLIFEPSIPQLNVAIALFQSISISLYCQSKKLDSNSFSQILLSI